MFNTIPTPSPGFSRFPIWRHILRHDNGRGILPPDFAEHQTPYAECRMTLSSVIRVRKLNESGSI